MIKMFGEEYCTDKEAASRYGYSQAWFKKMRLLKKGPPFMRMGKKVLYSMKKVEDWFRAQIQQIN